jgi:hypothetical protein
MPNCPGNSLEFKKPEEVVSYTNCDYCKKPVEMWFDESKRKCPDCKEYVFKNPDDLEKDYKCAVWCKEAESCIGPKTYIKLKESLEKIL